jgi:hypothetical protein
MPKDLAFDQTQHYLDSLVPRRPVEMQATDYL